MNISLAGYTPEECWMLSQINELYKEQLLRPLEEADVPLLLIMWGTPQERLDAQLALRALINTVFDQYFDDLDNNRDMSSWNYPEDDNKQDANQSK